MQQYSDISFEIFTIDNLFTNKELEEYKNFIENIDIKNRQFTNSNFKNGKSINNDLSQYIYSKLLPYLPNNYIDRNNKSWKFNSACKYIFYSKLESNQLFNLHTDTGSEYDDKQNIYSKYTALLYLNDDFEGGNTQFFDLNGKKTCTIIPKKNRILIFDIDLWHSGELITEGNKYWIGTEILCNKFNSI